MNIAIDGPSGAGKSTIAKLLAKKLGIVYLDTGAMYRAFGLKVYRNEIESSDEVQIVPLLQTTKIDITYTEGEQRIFLDGEDVSKEIREHHISRIASDVSKIHAVRLAMVNLQRAIAKKSNSVLDGRDIGSFVLPNAKYKFYLTASSDERAKRRHLELTQKGEEVSLESIKADIESRDHNDMNRDFAPLVQAKDAVLVDSTALSIEAVVELIFSYVHKKYYPKKKRKKKKPSKIKKFFIEVAYLFIMTFYRFMALFVAPIRVVNRKRIPRRARYIAVSNHLSHADIFYHVFRMPWRRAMIAKNELKKSKFCRAMSPLLPIIFIDRESPDIAAIKRILGHLKQNRGAFLYPEGTRNTENRELLPLKSGASMFAIKGDAPILPTAVYVHGKLLKRNVLYIGEMFDLKEYAGKRLTAELLAEADEKVRFHMLKTMEEMDTYVKNKGWDKKLDKLLPENRKDKKKGKKCKSDNSDDMEKSL